MKEIGADFLGPRSRRISLSQPHTWAKPVARSSPLHNVNYTVLRGFYDPASDLVIWEIRENFPAFAPLYPRQDEVGQVVSRLVAGNSEAILTLSTARCWAGSGDLRMV